MVFEHYLAYGNSDQASFRNAEVHASFDVMTVPGTIASYYAEATAAFVLTSQLRYLIDPRTPLFQGALEDARASHFSLAEWHGKAVTAELKAGGQFEQSFYSDEVVVDLTQTVLNRQRNYGDNALLVEKKMNRYAALLAQAMQDQGEPTPARGIQPPAYTLAPYFAVSGVTDDWWAIQVRVWESVLAQDYANSVSPVICVDGRDRDASGSGVDALREALEGLPEGMSNHVFFWITNFDERKVRLELLVKLWSLVSAFSETKELVNLYGGFFSICLSRVGLSGFGNGLTYSESRDWPALSSTGAAPPRYYVPKLHMFLPVGLAASFVDEDDFFECGCTACTDWRGTGNSIASLPYHDLKRHFAVARKAEIEAVSSQALPDLASSLEEAHGRAEQARSAFQLRDMASTGFLLRWAHVLRHGSD